MSIGRFFTIAAAMVSLACGAETRTFQNPLLPSGPDPWVIVHDGIYYFMSTTGVNLTIWKTRHIGDLKSAEKQVVWRPPASGPYSHDIWTPELHRFGDRWYIYFSADDGSNMSHRVWVLENATADPMSANWTLKGKIADPGDHWEIDGSAFQNRGRIYFIWSGWQGPDNGTQRIYIAALKNPWTMDGDRVLLSTPEHPWEKAGDLKAKHDLNENPGTYRRDPIHIDVNEGPEILQHGNRIFLTYSASACWTDFYELGMLTASAESNLLDPKSWKKSELPVFWESPDAHAFGTGHNGFFESPDGKENWIIYHANSQAGEGCGRDRSPRAQRFTWNADGSPNFGRPAPIGQALRSPSGELK